MDDKVTFFVAECHEFHSMGEYHEGIEDVNEAIRLWNEIPADRMHGIKSIGIMIPDEDALPFEVDIVVGSRIDLDMLDYIPGAWENSKVLTKLGELVANFPDLEANREIPEPPKEEAVQVRRHRGR